MFDLFTLAIVAVLLLTAYLYFSINRRITGARAEKWCDFRTKPIDVSTLNPAIRRVRNNPKSERPGALHRHSRRSRLIANARELVTTLAFFRRRGEEKSPQNI